jgi:hypothetical protein
LRGIWRYQEVPPCGPLIKRGVRYRIKIIITMTIFSIHLLSRVLRDNAVEEIEDLVKDYDYLLTFLLGHMVVDNDYYKL